MSIHLPIKRIVKSSNRVKVIPEWTDKFRLEVKIIDIMMMSGQFDRTRFYLRIRIKVNVLYDPLRLTPCLYLSSSHQWTSLFSGIVNTNSSHQYSLETPNVYTSSRTNTITKMVTYVYNFT